MSLGPLRTRESAWPSLSEPRIRVPFRDTRALYFFRWGTLYTWVTGFLLMRLKVGWGLTKFLYTKSASPAPASF